MDRRFQAKPGGESHDLASGDGTRRLGLLQRGRLPGALTGRSSIAGCHPCRQYHLHHAVSPPLKLAVLRPRSSGQTKETRFRTAGLATVPGLLPLRTASAAFSVSTRTVSTERSE